MTAWAEEEELAFRTESGGNWTPYTLELDCSVYQTEQMVCIQAEYYSYTGGAPPQHGTAGLELRPDDGPVLRA